MKKITVLILSLIMVGNLCGCAKSAETRVIEEPDIIQIRSICNLATLECYYHNVAKGEKTAGTGILNIGEKDRTFWIEYTGVAKVGIDMSRVAMELKGEEITITLPKAELISVDVEELTEDSFVYSTDGLNKNKITAEDQTLAFKTAQEEMMAEVSQNSSLLITAQNRAQELIYNYIDRLGEISGVAYRITWVYEE